MKEIEIQNRALLALSKGPTRLFRQNTAMGWAGKVLARNGSTLIIDNARPLHAGLCRGSADTIGWHTIEITPEMVGTRVAVFAAIEFKAPGKRPTAEQGQFGGQVLTAGGIYGVAWSVEDAVEIIGGFDKSLICKG